jgi:molybdate transport system substrate-binding protein
LSALKVFCTIAVRGAVSELLPSLERELGHRLDVTWGTAPMLLKRIDAGETADTLILSEAAIVSLKKSGRLVPGTEVTLASSATAIAVKAGAPKPDISTPDAFVKALLNAKGVAYTHPSAGGASGVYFAQLIERLGIANEINAKAKHPPAGGFSGELLLTGDADIAIQQKPELMHVAGTEVIGLFPGELNVVTVFVGAVMAGSKHGAPAKALIDMLRAPDAVALFRAKGLETP